MATNPILAELNGLSPEAKAALQAAHGATTSQAAMQPPHLDQARSQSQPLPPSQPATMQAPSQIDSIPQMGQKPNVTLAPQPKGRLMGDQQALQEMAGKKPALESVYGKISGSNFGQAHPVAGKVLGALAQIPATVADIGASGVAPRIGALIPGTSVNRGLQLRGLENRIGEEEANAGKEAQTAALQAEVPLREAETRKAATEAEIAPSEARGRLTLQDAQIQNLLHPQARTEFEVWRQQNPDKPVEDWLTTQAGTKSQKPDTPEQQFIDEFQRKNPNGTIADAVHAYAAATQKPERGPTIIQQTGEADKVATRLGKPYETAATQGQSKLDRIDQTLHSVNAGYVGQGLAIPELLTSLVSGQGTGVRITQPELNAITAHRGIQGNAESWFNSLAGKGSLTDQDKAQIKGVLGEAKVRLLEKQNIMNSALDSINGAETRAQVVEADKMARNQLADLERTGHYIGQKITLKDGSTKTVTTIHPDGSFDAN
jgi:hypothetical protein